MIRNFLRYVSTQHPLWCAAAALWIVYITASTISHLINGYFWTAAFNLAMNAAAIFIGGWLGWRRG